MKIKKEVVRFVSIFALVALLFFVVGQEGCEIPGFDGGGAQASKTGLDYTLFTGIDYLSAGKVVEQGETFYVALKIENYDKEDRTGQVCIRDDVADSYGGIPDQECKLFSVGAAEIVKKESSNLGGTKVSEQLTPGIVEVYFPEYGEYSYGGLPAAERWNQKLFVSLRYRQVTRALATITVPDQTQPVVSQEPAPISVSVMKAVRKRQDGYKIDLDFSLRKQGQARIFSPDFTQENVTFFKAEMFPKSLTCSTMTGEPIKGIIDFKNERLIKCSSLVYLRGEAQQSYPLVTTLDYGVSVDKNYGFGIKAK